MRPHPCGGSRDPRGEAVFRDEIRRAAEGAARVDLPAVAAALWRAFAEGHVTEAEAEGIAGLIEARQVVPVAPQPAPARRGSRPRTDASMERRRRWAASGRMPPAIAARFTLAEQAVLSLIAAETCRRKDCRLSVGGMAAIAGVSETTVRNAIREAEKLDLLTVEERRLTGWRSDTNVIRIVAPEWVAWLRLTRKRKVEAPAPVSEGGGCKSANPTPTEISDRGKLRQAGPPQRLPRGGRAARWC